MDLMTWASAHPGSAFLLFLLGLFLLVLLSKWIRYIPNTRVGIVEKLISGKGSVKTGFIALNGEAGFQPELLRGGWHFLTPFQYRIHKLPLVTIPQGKIGYVFARDGQDLPSTQALASNERAKDFQDLRAFFAAGGQKGPQSSRAPTTWWASSPSMTAPACPAARSSRRRLARIRSSPRPTTTTSRTRTSS